MKYMKYNAYISCKYCEIVIKLSGSLLTEGKNMPGETKRERFLRVAESRTNKLLDMMKLLGNCSTQSNYDYTNEDIKKIFDTLEKELKNTKNRFIGIEEKEIKFSLR